MELPKLLKGETKIEARSEFRKLLEFVGLSDRMFNKPGQLSGGEQQGSTYVERSEFSKNFVGG